MKTKTKIAPRPRISGFCNRTLPRTPEYDPHQRCHGCDCRADRCPCNPEQETTVTDTPSPAELIATIKTASEQLGVALYGLELEPDDWLRMLRDVRRALTGLQIIDSGIVRDVYLTAEHGKRVIDGFGEVWITRGRKREHWEGRAAVFDYVAARIFANGGEMPDPNVVADWVLEVLPASSCRVTPLREAGLDVGDYRTSDPGKPQVTVPLD